MSVVVTNRQNLVRNCMAYGRDLGLMFVSNGEERPYTLFVDGTIIDAGLPEPPQPTVADLASGNLTNGTWAVYAIVYVIQDTYPLVATNILGNPSTFSAPYNVTGTGDRQVRVTFTGSSKSYINKCWIYRTDLQSDSASAQLAADSGLLYFLGEVTNSAGSLTYDDNTLSNIGNDPIEQDNFPAPQFRYCVYDGEYFWGFANHPLRFTGSWTSAGVITITDATNQFYTDGRNDQYVTLAGVTTGGIDGKGTHLFKYLSGTTAQTVDEDGANAAIGSTGTDQAIVVSGETANLYRSKYKNPYAWGYYKAYADEYIPERWAIRVAGGLGTAIAVLPDQKLLKLDIEFPAECVTYNLQTSATDVFEQTKASLSQKYSVTSHFSQFSAISRGREVLWGMDYKNLCIVESDGLSQIPVSSPISSIIRELAATRAIQLFSHGIYDPKTELNAIWVSTGATEFKNDLCIYQHAPTGYWGIIDDYDVLCSATIEDENTSQRRTLVGTESGFVGYAFDDSTFGNWLPSTGSYQGLVTSSTSISINTDKTDLAYTNLIGNYVVIVWPNGITYEVRRIATANSIQLGFGTAFITNPPVGSAWYIGVIPVSVLKYFDRGAPNMDKGAKEVWMTLENASTPQVRYYLEHSQTPSTVLDMKQDASLDAWFLKNGFPNRRHKTFGVELRDLSYSELKFYNLSVK